ncbi:TonB family protein [Burkholderia stagnalis]|uniref:TonB family protein n=1 Tax=Burkholderia stagnalis TaxID=1503054 RepID=UPI000F56623B|nr:TonB family protein [Burkholderia stagnalis]
MSTVESALFEFALPAAPARPGGMAAHWRDARGPAASVALHALALAALFAWSTHAPDKPPPERTIELVLTQAAPAPTQPQPPQPKAQPAPPPPRRTVAAPPETHAPRAPAPRAAAPSEAAPRPVQPAPAAPSAEPAPPAAPAAQADAPARPAAPSTPAPARVIGQEGIPSDYVRQVFERINRSAIDRYPRLARLKHLDGRVGYRLVLAPDGTLVRCDIQTSGEDTLDAAALDAIRAAAPFPKLPDLGGSSYVLKGAIVYQSE